MPFGKKKKEEEEKKELTMQEAIVEIGHGLKEIREEITELKKQPKEVQPATPEPVKPQVKQETPSFMIYDEPIKFKRVVIDNSNPDNPIVYDTETALAKILNDIAEMKKAL